MANIPGLLGFVSPGAYSVTTLRPGPVSLPGGPTIVSILGRGRREEFLAERAVGGGADGEPVGFNAANSPDGRHFQLSFWPIVPGSLEVFINPIGDGTDLPLIRITDQAAADAWIDEFGDTDGYSNFAGFNGPSGDSIDGYQASSDGSGFFDSKYARQFAALKEKLGITAGSPEPNHYILDETNGRLILDQALAAFDTLVVSYIAESDINGQELFINDLAGIFRKHGFPSKENTISLAAQMANENGASVFLCVHAGEELTGAGSSRRLIAQPTLSSALANLEKEELDFLVPVMSSRVSEEIIMPFYDTASHSTLTGGGAYLQEDPATGDQPGINISPLAVIPVGEVNAGDPVFLEVRKNGVLLEYDVDYSVPNLDGSALNGTTNVLIALDPAYPGATHSNDNTLVDGDKVTASYLPDPTVINLIATAQLACLTHAQIMSETKNRLERNCLFGGYEFTDLDFLLDPITGIEANFGTTKRVQFFWPGGETITRVVAGEIQTLDAQFIAPCAAGFYASHPIPTSLTNKTLSGFTINPAFKLSVDETNFAGGAGVAIVRPLAAGGKVIIGQTTTNSGRAVEEEMSVVRISDFTAQTVRRALENAFTGTTITPNTIDSVKAATISLLSQLQSQGILNTFANVQTVVDPNEPRQINVTFDITPVFPLNWIFIRFSIGI